MGALCYQLRKEVVRDVVTFFPCLVEIYRYNKGWKKDRESLVMKMHGKSHPHGGTMIDYKLQSETAHAGVARL
ncbi:hypothetical protein [Anoxybacillus sp. J5B_2022]|uniref:hypothetical protein n=1 Tax=Anoxybacillus sp. J5B_2022 TaxID=3003246 RepID=UPI00228614E0|nr:hypothetical protein [Anoxybacillus sp. J5B_2022]MCZ0756599.1 hypothetical protein [Anoxybacillus sp. J5B_2022]